LDDKILYNERKIEEKSKLINSIMEAQKDNGVLKLTEKFRVFQT
jgi:hypothetical protein